MAAVEVRGGDVPRRREILTEGALEFVAGLHRAFEPRRRELLQARTARQRRLEAGERPDFLAATREIRDKDWRIAPVPKDLEDRRVEITGPVERKMVINALNSGARVFMADFEDAHSPTWVGTVAGQGNLIDALERTIEVSTPQKTYRLKEDVATLLVRPRGWHLDERHVRVDGQPVSASLFDFGLYLYHNHARLRTLGTGPYFYLPKLEGHLEARLWNDVFVHAQRELGLPVGTIKATVLIETILAAFEMDEILWELREHAAGLNAGRWDYIFSAIKKLRHDPSKVLPDRAQVTMTVPFMRAYAQLLVKVCHRRGAHAMGGMAAFIPSRKDAKVNEIALAKVREDKLREVGDGFDGTWVAHPDLVPVAMGIFDEKLGRAANQVTRQRTDVGYDAAALLDLRVPNGRVTEQGLRNNLEVALLYLESWLAGAGAVAIHNLMEDAATAEISRSQVWQWIRHGARLDDGRPVTRELAETILAEELARLRADRPTGAELDEAARLLRQVALAPEFVDFLTLPAYDQLTASGTA